MNQTSTEQNLEHLKSLRRLTFNFGCKKKKCAYYKKGQKINLFVEDCTLSKFKLILYLIFFPDAVRLDKLFAKLRQTKEQNTNSENLKVNRKKCNPLNVRNLTDITNICRTDIQ